MKKFWNDEAGFVVTVEMILVATVLVIGLVAGLTVLRDAVLSELTDTAQAFGVINQSYAVNSATNVASQSAAFSYVDTLDSVDADPTASSTTGNDGLIVIGTEVAARTANEG